MSMRQSLIIWVGGAIGGWVLLVFTIYNVLRLPNAEVIQADIQPDLPASMAEEVDRLNRISPASGGQQVPLEGDDLDDDDEDEEDEDETEEQKGPPKIADDDSNI